jgi:hypothetical protein
MGCKDQTGGATVVSPADATQAAVILPTEVARSRQATVTALLLEGQAQQAILGYKACPQEEDTLADVLSRGLKAVGSNFNGMRVVAHDQDTIQIAALYPQGGQIQTIIWSYRISTGEITGVDQLANSMLNALRSECDQPQPAEAPTATP